MIVDDIDITRKELKRLKLWGVETGFIISDEAKNGYEALLKLEINPVDIVITDIKMPKIDGLELLQKIINKNHASCVVLMSDYTDFCYVRQGLVLGAFDYIEKPVEEGELNIILQRAKAFIIDKRREQKRLKEIEEKLNQKWEDYFPKADVNLIIQFICDGNPNALDATFQLLNRIGVNSNNDLVKIEIALKNILSEIGSKLFEVYDWLQDFLDINNFINIDFSKCNDFDSAREIFLVNIEKCIFIIAKLQLCRQESSIAAQVCKCVLQNVDGEVSLKFVADKLFMNKTYIGETFKQKTGITFVGYLTTVKMERGIKLITEGKLKVYEIGDRLGFKDVEYFSKLFKKYTGLTPTEFRNSIQ